MGPLPPETKGVKEFVVDALHNLTYSGHPLPQALGPAPLAAIALGWMNNPRPVALLPPSMVLSTLKTLVGYVGCRGDRADAGQPGVRLGSYSEEGFRHLLVGCRSSSEAKARDDPSRICGGEQAKALIPSQTIAPTNVGAPGKPSVSSTLTVPDGHRRTVEGLV